MPRRLARETTRHGVELVDIASPYTGTDRVFRVMDGMSLLRMYHIGDRETQAAAKYLRAEMILAASGMHCALAAEPGCSSPASRTPALTVLAAVQTIKQAADCLGTDDFWLVRHVVVNGETLKTLGYTARTLRSALSKLTDLWFGTDTHRISHACRASDARPDAGNGGELIPGKAAHASRKGVVYG
jgi:hypothetical protein